jgi:hypothetical protein
MASTSSSGRETGRQFSIDRTLDEEWRHTHGVSERYWDYREAKWVRPPAPEDTESEVPVQRTGLEQVEEADVRSG